MHMIIITHKNTLFCFYNHMTEQHIIQSFYTKKGLVSKNKYDIHGLVEDISLY